MDSTLTHRHQYQTENPEAGVDKIHRYFAKLDFGYIDDEKLLGWMIPMSRQHMSKTLRLAFQASLSNVTFWNRPPRNGTRSNTLVVKYVVKNLAENSGGLSIVSKLAEGTVNDHKVVPRFPVPDLTLYTAYESRKTLLEDLVDILLVVLPIWLMGIEHGSGGWIQPNTETGTQK
jgi:hypothetical protein